MSNDIRLGSVIKLGARLILDLVEDDRVRTGVELIKTAVDVGEAVMGAETGKLTTEQARQVLADLRTRALERADAIAREDAEADAAGAAALDKQFPEGDK